MRLNTLELRGATRFAETVSIDFDAIGPGLVALTGSNGQGKTTLMEAIPAALFRSFPSRSGNLNAHCQGRDAYIDLRFSMGDAAYRSLVKIDAEQGGQSAVLFNSDGSAPLTSGKVTDYDAAVRARVAEPAIFLASVFSAQNGAGNFLDASKADRKGLFVRMLGLDHLQVLSDSAKLKARGTETAIATLNGKASGLRIAVEGRAAIESIVAHHQADLVVADAEVARCDAELAEAKDRLAGLAAASDSLSDLMAQQAAIGQEITTLGEQLGQARDKATELRTLLGNAETFLLRRAEIEGAEADAATARASLVTVDADIARVEEAERRETIMLRRRSEAQDGVRKAEAEVARVTHDVAKYERELDRSQETSGLLNQVPCGDTFPTCQFLTTAVAEREKISHWSGLAKEAAVALTQANTSLAKAQEGAQGYLFDPAAGERLTRELAALRGNRTTLVNQIAQLEKVVTLRPHLDIAAAAVIERTGQIDEVEANAVQLGGAIVIKQAQVQDLQVKANAARQAQADRGAASMAVSGAETTLQEQRRKRDQIQTAIGEASGKLAELAKAVDDLAAIDVEIAGLLQEQADWTSLSKALGQNGVQALEIDAAGPEVSSLTNELLESCFGTRFTVSFETTRIKADGDTAETFDVRVIDNERGREGAVGSLSGGEKVILNEAISLALALFNARKSERKLETLFRDETAGALDPENAARYVLMLRRAMALGGFHQCLFIAHQPDVYESADTIIRVAGGKATVQCG